MKQAAIIKRASQQARNAMQQLDAGGVADLLEIYTRAAEEVRAAIRAKVGPDEAVPREHLQGLLRQIEDIITRLGTERDAALTQAITEAAALGVRPYTVQGAMAVGGVVGTSAPAVLESGAAMKISQTAVEFVMNFRAADGLTLSDRLWRMDQGAKEALTRAVANAVVQGWSGAKAAQDLALRGVAIPADVAAQVRGAKADRLVGLADLLTSSKSGAEPELWKAERVLRTEINRAHGEAYMAGAQQTPGFAGFQFLLSPRHPKPDICFRRGTLVTTRRGPVPIEDVKIGDDALTHLGRWRPVVKLYRSASGPNGLVRLRCQAANSRTLEAVMTPNHPVLTPSGWIPAGDLRTGSRVVCLDRVPALPLPLCGAGADRTASRGSGGTASGFGVRTSEKERCDGYAPLAHCTPRTVDEGLPLPTGWSMTGAAMRLWSGFRLSIRGFLASCAGLTSIAEIAPSAGTYRGGACQSSGCLHQSSGHTPCSNISAPCGSRGKRTTSSKSDRSAAWWRGLADSRCSNSTRWPVSPPSSVAQRSFFHNLGIWHQPACLGPSTAPRRHDRKSAWWPFAVRAPIGLGWVSAACRSVRRFLFQACAEHISFKPHHAIVDKLDATGEEVFNLEVEGDHSYVANGIVVHNCDLLAEQNVHGLGPGVYPTREQTPWPAHPNTLSFVVMVFEDDITPEDRAGKETELQALQRLAPEVRAGALGVTKAAYFDQGLLRRGMVRSTLRAVDARLTRQGKL